MRKSNSSQPQRHSQVQRAAEKPPEVSACLCASSQSCTGNTELTVEASSRSGSLTLFSRVRACVRQLRRQKAEPVCVAGSLFYLRIARTVKGKRGLQLIAEHNRKSFTLYGLPADDAYGWTQRHCYDLKFMFQTIKSHRPPSISANPYS